MTSVIIAQHSVLKNAMPSWPIAYSTRNTTWLSVWMTNRIKNATAPIKEPIAESSFLPARFVIGGRINANAMLMMDRQAVAMDIMPELLK